MRRRHRKKISNERLPTYGRSKASGSRKLRRGRRTLLAAWPTLRNHDSLTPVQHLRWLEKALDKMVADYAQRTGRHPFENN